MALIDIEADIWTVESMYCGLKRRRECKFYGVMSISLSGRGQLYHLSITDTTSSRLFPLLHVACAFSTSQCPSDHYTYSDSSGLKLFIPHHHCQFCSICR